MGSAWVHRLLGVVGLAGRRVLGRVRVAPQRLLLTVLGVGVAVGLMIAVTGVSLGLASDTVVQSDGVDYWIVPEQSTVSTVTVSTGSVQLGATHTVSEEIERDARVESATPVLLELLPLRDAVTGEREYVLAIGIVPDESGSSLSGMSTGGLRPGDPYYRNGSYDGSWTGDVVVNEAAAQLLNVSTGTRLDQSWAGGDRPLAIRNVTAGGVGPGGGSAPVALFHLSELQTLTGAGDGDHADQILVRTDDSSVESRLETVYPQTTVVTKRGLTAQQLSLSNLPLAVAVAALVVGVVIGVLFVATLMGLEVSASDRQLAVLGAIGYGRRRRMTLVAVESLLVSLVGGLVGCLFGGLGVLAINHIVAPRVGTTTVARFDPLLFGYALGVALVIGLVGAIYPTLLSRRTEILEVLDR